MLVAPVRPMRLIRYPEHDSAAQDDPEKYVRVLLISTMFPTTRTPSGGTFVAQRVRAHREAGLDVTALALRHTPDATTARVLSALGKSRNDELLGDDFDDAAYVLTPFDLLRAKRGYPGAKLLDHAAASVLRRINGSTFDIVHAHGMYLVPAGAIAKHVSTSIGVPYVVTCHRSDINMLMPSRAPEYARVLDNAAAVAYVSDALRDRARELGSQTDRGSSSADLRQICGAPPDDLGPEVTHRVRGTLIHRTEQRPRHPRRPRRLPHRQP